MSASARRASRAHHDEGRGASVGEDGGSLSASSSGALDALASPPLYTEAEHGGGPGQVMDRVQAPSYQPSAQGGDRTVLGGPPLSYAASSAGGPTGPAGTAVAAVATQPNQDDVFFDIAPGSDATSFQIGYLGMEGFQAWIKGEVLLKLGSPALSRGASYYKCVIELRAVESVDVDASEWSPSFDAPGEVELFYSSLTLWDATVATSSTVTAQEVPKTMPFSFALTQDLPHCVHLPKSRLAYTLTATLHSSKPTATPNLVKAVPVHLTRYSAPGPLSDNMLPSGHTNVRFGLQAHIWQASSPVQVNAQLERTLYRRSEPMNIRVLIPALPDQRLMTEKRLQLRAVEADLVRIITVLPSKRPSSSVNDPTVKAKGKLAEASWSSQQTNRAQSAAEEDDGEKVPSYDASMATQGDGPAEPGPSTRGATQADESPPEPQDHSYSMTNGHEHQGRRNRYETLLAHSGKLCRFSTHRAVHLRLTLHPPFSAPNMPHPHPDHDAFAVAARSAAMYVRPGEARNRRAAEPGRAVGSEQTMEPGSTQDFQAGPSGQDGPSSVSTFTETAAPGSLAGGSGCESITQETLLHRVTFEVRVRVAIDGGDAGRKDLRFSREVGILPGAAGEALDDQSLGEDRSAGSTSAQAATALQTVVSVERGDATLTERRAEKASQALDDVRAQGHQVGDLFATFDEEEEYDGYEDVFQDIDRDDLPPSVDDAGRTSLDTLTAVPFLATRGADASQIGGSSLRHAGHAQAVTRSAESLESEPPPTLQQSQHDLQVDEVEVAGVGFAVPRGSVVQHGDEAAPGFYESYSSPPPALLDLSSPTYPGGGAEHDEPPPPPPPSSPPPEVKQADGSPAAPLPAALAPLPAEGRVSAQTRNAAAQRGSLPSAPEQAHQPPPYLAAHDRRQDEPPSFDERGLANIVTVDPRSPTPLGLDPPPVPYETASQPMVASRSVGTGHGPAGSHSGGGIMIFSGETRSPVANAHLALHGHDHDDGSHALPPAYAQPLTPPPTLPNAAVLPSPPSGPPSYSLR